MSDTSFDLFASEYSQVMGEEGDYTHANTIDPALFKCVGSFKGKIVYDVACGNGYLSRKLLIEGAKEVWASDLSEKLIELAKKRKGNQVRYSVRRAEDISDLPTGYFDLIIMNMALHYMPDLDLFFSQMKQLLKKKGRIVFTTNHPMRDLARLEMKAPDTNIERVISRAKSYLKVFKDQTMNMWTGNNNLVIYRAPISVVINSLAKNGLYVDCMIEPVTLTNYSVGHQDSSDIPFIYALGARKID